jgi:hypothetical protein
MGLQFSVTAKGEKALGFEADREWVVDELRKLYDASVDAGRMTAAIRALELIGRCNGMFKLADSCSGDVYIVDNIADLPDGAA